MTVEKRDLRTITFKELLELYPPEPKNGCTHPNGSWRKAWSGHGVVDLGWWCRDCGFLAMGSELFNRYYREMSK